MSHIETLKDNGDMPSPLLVKDLKRRQGIRTLFKAALLFPSSCSSCWCLQLMKHFHSIQLLHSFKNVFIFNWRIIALQYYVDSYTVDYQDLLRKLYFSNISGIFTKINSIVDLKANLNKFQSGAIVFSDHIKIIKNQCHRGWLK